MVIGVSTLIGWVLDIPRLTAWKSTSRAMPPVSALAVLALGITIHLLQRPDLTPGRRRAIRVLGSLVAVPAMLLTAARVFGVPSAVERFLLLDQGNGTGTGGSPNASVAFALAAALVVLASSRKLQSWRLALAIVGGSVITLTGALFLLENIYGLPLLYAADRVPISLNTSLSLVLVGLASSRLAARHTLSNLGDTGATASIRLTAVGATAIAILAGAYAYYHQQELQVRARTQAEIDEVSRLKLTGLVQWRTERLGDGAVIQQNPYVIDTVAQLISGQATVTATRAFRQWLAAYRTYQQYDRALVITASGESIMFDDSSATISPVLIGAAAEAIRANTVTLQDFYQDRAVGAPRLALVVAVPGPGGRPSQAALVLRIDPDAFLHPLIEIWQGRSHSAETELLRRGPTGVQFLNALRFDAGRALQPQPTDPNGTAIFARAARGETGPIEGADYRGVDAIAFIRPVPDSPWILVTKIDRHELRQQLWQQVLLIGSLTLALLVAGGSTVVWIWRRESRHSLRRQASMAAALGESEERLRLALSAARQGLYDLNVQTGQAIVTAEYAAMLGYDPLTFRETSAAWFDRLHPDDRASAGDAYEAHIAGRSNEYRVEFRQRTATGGWKWVLALGRLIERTPDGRPLRMIGTHTDIDARKIAELRAHRLANLYAALSQCNEAIVRSATEAELFPRVCRSAVVHGGMAMAWIGMSQPDGDIRCAAAHGAGSDLLMQAGHIAHGSTSGPTSIALRDGRAIWSSHCEHTPPLPWEQRGREFGWSACAALPLTRHGATVGALTIYAYSDDAFDADGRRLLEEMAKDISFALGNFDREARREEAEVALREKDRFLSESQRIAHVGSWTLGPDGPHFWSDEMFRLFGLPASDRPPTREAFMQRVHPGDHDIILDAIERAWASQAPVEFEHRLRMDDGSVRYLFTRAEARRDHGGGDALEGATQDVTEQRLAELARRETEARYRNLVDHAPVAIFVNRDDRVVLVNDACVRLFGAASPAELIGRSPVALFDPAHAELIRSRVSHLQASGTAHTHQPERIVRMDGSMLDVEVSAAVFDDAGVRAIHVAIIDMSDRHRTEELLRGSVREKEALLKEVHHRVKNNLQVITSLLRLESGRSADAGVRTVLSEMQDRILSMALLHETLYRSGTFASIDLARYVTQLAQQVFRSQSASPGITLRVTAEPTSIELDQAIPCGLLVNELVSNALKHGFPGRATGHVALTLAHVDNALVLTVTDDGVGLPADFDTRRVASLGLQLVSDLTRQLRGTLTVGTGPGASFRVVFTPRQPSSADTTERTPS